MWPWTHRPLALLSSSLISGYSGPDLWTISSPLAAVEQPPRGTPGPVYFFHKPPGLPLLPPATGYALGAGQPEVPSVLPRAAPASSGEPHQDPSQALTFLLAPGIPYSGLSSWGSVPSHPNSLCLIPPGSRPEGRFSALIWVGPPGQPPLKLIQAVAGSQHCAQVCPLPSWSPGIQGGGKDKAGP